MTKTRENTLKTIRERIDQYYHELELLRHRLASPRKLWTDAEVTQEINEAILKLNCLKSLYEALGGERDEFDFGTLEDFGELSEMIVKRPV